MNPAPAISQLVHRLALWFAPHATAPNRYVLAAAVVVAGYVALRLVRRVIGWVFKAAIVAVALVVAYRLMTG